MNKMILAGLIIFLIIFILFSPARAAKNQELTIAFVPKSLDNPIFLDTFEAAAEEAKNLGVKLEWIAPFNTDTDAQIKVMERLIKKNVDGIILSVNDSSSLEEVINKAVAAGIPVATFDADSPESKRMFYIGTDNYQAGKVMGNVLINILNSKNISRNDLDIMILSGDKGALNLNKRIIAFKKVVKSHVLIKNIDILYCNDNIQLAIELVEDYLKHHPGLDIIFFVGGWPFYAPADAMPNFQKWAQKGGIAVGIDIFYSGLVLEKEGLIDYLIGQDFAEMGKRSLQYIVNYLDKGESPNTWIHTGLTYANRDNLGELLKIYKPWEVR